MGIKCTLLFNKSRIKSLGKFAKMLTCEDHLSSWYMVVLSRPSILSLVLDISVDIDTEDGVGDRRTAFLTNTALDIFFLLKSRAGPGLFQTRWENASRSDFLGPDIVVNLLSSSLNIPNEIWNLKHFEKVQFLYLNCWFLHLCFKLCCAAEW